MSNFDKKTVLRLEKHIINKNHRLYEYCDRVCYESKNLYNRANYIVRQEYLANNKIVTAFDLNKLIKEESVYRALPAKTSQQINIQLGNNWKAFFASVKDWSNNKKKYLGKPKMPKYKKKNGRNVVFFDYQQGSFKDSKYHFAKTRGDKSVNYIETSVTRENFRQCRIVPYGNCYKIEIVYKKEVETLVQPNKNTLAIDLGLDNLATLTNNVGMPPIIINGKVLKSINNYYNKKLARLRSYIGRGTSNRIIKLNTKRMNIIDTHMHRISRYIINYCVNNNITNIAIGKNDTWKQGFKRQQGFVSMPFELLINQLKYKGEDVGINVIEIDEKYTSQSSFVDGDMLPNKFGDYVFSGKRVERGLYRSKNGILINADVNGSYNILRKSNPEFSYDRIKGVSLHPTRVSVN